jgi:hypothetical protein
MIERRKDCEAEEEKNEKDSFSFSEEIIIF